MDDKSVAPFFSGFLIGALVGAAAALLMAPQSGEETRAQIREKSVELKEKAEATYADVLHRVEEATEEIRQKTDEISAKVDQAIAQGKQEVAKLTKKAEQTAEEVQQDITEA